MENLKIHVANEAESKEAQELFFDLGYYWAYKNLGKKLLLSKNNVYLFAESDRTLGTGTHQDEVFFNNWRGKEITLQELRDMVNPMKEYLEPSNNYSLIKAHRKEGNDWIKVPDGAEAFGYTGMVKTFYKDDFRSFFNENTDGQWEDRSDTWIGRKEPVILWQRHTQPEELPFMDSLNDQYAEIEQVRQQTIEATLAERQAQYGSFVGVANTTGALMAVIKNSKNGSTLPYAHEEALHMICSKIARIVNGDYNHKDSWHDIGGYSKLIEDLL